MNVTLNKVLWFTAGAAVGVAVSAKFFKTKYNRIAQEEIDSVKRAFSMPLEFEAANTYSEEDDGIRPTPEEVTAYHAIIHDQGYIVDDTPEQYNGKETEGVSNKPYVISPTEFGTEDDYEVHSLTYYADGILTDDQDNLIEDVEAMVGRDSLTHYGEYEDDSVHVRNDAMKCDFEILRDLRNYSDVCRNGPRPDED